MVVESRPATMPAFPLPRFPKLRPAEPRWVRHEGEPRLWLRDPLELSEHVVLIPPALAPLLAALDGTRDRVALREAFAAHSGVALPLWTIEAVLSQLDAALLLESPRADWVHSQAVARFRAAPHRAPALAARSYPAEPAALDAHLSRLAGRVAGVPPMRPLGRAAGVLSPHIDYARGDATYAATWLAAVDVVAGADVVLVFGTDHRGGAGRWTPTRQRYATPWGALPTDDAVVTALEDALGADAAYAEELHHRTEHSIELAAVWLHWALRRSGKTAGDWPAVVAVLCGSFQRYMSNTQAGKAGALLPEADPRAMAALDALQRALGGRRVVVVAAADLAHVGPAFGDDTPLTGGDKARLRRDDARMLAAAAAGDAGAFLAHLRVERDRRRVCGLPPIYWALRMLERLGGRPAEGRLVEYRQCPADQTAGSVVSIAGMLWQ